MVYIDVFLRIVDMEVKDPRLRRLVRRVWRRLPPYDKRVIRALVLDVEDEGYDTGPGVLGSTAAVAPSMVWDGCAADAALDLQYGVYLRRAKAIEDDKACMCVIAHELAHVVLRHSQISTVIAGLPQLEAEPIYSEADLDGFKFWHEEAADLLVWVWGFQEEFEAFLEAYPEARRPRWYVFWETEGLDHEKLDQ